MNWWQTAISVASFIVSVSTILFFSVYPYYKKWKINKSFIRIENFYKIYSYLNPCFLYTRNRINDITLDLITQSFLSEGFPKFRYLIEKEYHNFDPFKLQDTNWSNTLTINEILYFYKFWKNALKKLEYIKKIINKYEYIMYVDGERELIVYRDNLQLIKTSISLCPSFDNIKLYGSLSGPGGEYEEKKFDLDKIDQLKNNKKFIDEMKSNKFSINLRFNSNFQNNIYSYSIIFDNDKVVNVETFFQKNIVNLKEEYIQELTDHLDWINKTFNIDWRKIISKKWLQYWVRDLKS